MHIPEAAPSPQPQAASGIAIEGLFEGLMQRAFSGQLAA